jgi:hypothetical protein
MQISGPNMTLSSTPKCEAVKSDEQRIPPLERFGHWLAGKLLDFGHWLATRVECRPRGVLTPDHPRLYSVLCTVAVLLLAWGPVARVPSKPEDWLWKLCPLFVALALLVAGNRAAHSRKYCGPGVAVYQAIVLGALALLVFFKGWGSSAVESGTYAHVGLLLFFVLIGVLVVDWLFALMFSACPGQFKMQLHVWATMESLRETEADKSSKLWHRFLSLPVPNLLLIPLPAGLALLFVPSENGLWWPLKWFPSSPAWVEWLLGGRAGLWWIAFLMLIVNWWVLAGLLGCRWGRHFIGAARRSLVTGPPCAVSLVVIAVAILRLGENRYIDYLFAIAPGGTNGTLIVYTVSAYVVSQLYGYWSARFEVQHFRSAFNCTDVVPPKVSPYGFDRLSIEVKSKSTAPTSAEAEPVVGKRELDNHPTPLKLAQELMITCATDCAAIKQLGKLRTLQNKCYVYAALRNVVPVVVIAFLLCGLSSLPQRAEMTVPPNPIKADFRLVDALAGKAGTGSVCQQASPGAPRIALAASGGGTRAALYTASVLEGLAGDNQLCNLVLASGVSGGSVALAYLARHHADLTQSGNPQAPGRSQPWVRFTDAMAYPFIQDVLEGVSELRMVIGERSGDGEWLGVRNGDLLAESIERRFGGQTTLGGRPFGLILNSSLAGAAPRWRWGGPKISSLDQEPLAKFYADSDKADCGGMPPASLAQREVDCAQTTTNEPAGGRLVFTNLSDIHWPEVGKATFLDPTPMAMVPLDDARISVSRASALSANFPPAFSNAAIDVKTEEPARRYWVTDGGVVENRGTLTMLMALDDAINTLANTAPQLPLLHVIVADASAPGGGFKQDRGFGASLGAGSQLGRAIEGLYMERLKKRYAKVGQGNRLFFHELAMPHALRAEGIGTHWMLPASVHLRCPPGIKGVRGCGERDELTLDRDQVVNLIIGLHSGLHSRKPVDLSERAKPVRDRWIEQDPVDNHPKVWRRLLSCLHSDKAGCTPDLH